MRKAAQVCREHLFLLEKFVKTQNNLQKKLIIPHHLDTIGLMPETARTYRFYNHFRSVASAVTKFILPWLPWILIGFFAIQYIRLGIINEIHLHNGLDLGTYTQILYNINNGNIPPFNTLKGQVAWGDHAHFIMILLAPIFALWQDPRTIIMIQAIAITTAGWALYKIAQDKVKNILFSLSILFSYLIFFGIQYALNFDFHANVLTAAILAWSFYAWYFKKHVLFWLTVILGLITREDAALFYVMFAVYVILFETGAIKKHTKLAYTYLKYVVFAPARRSFSEGGSHRPLLKKLFHPFNKISTPAFVLIIVSLLYFFAVTYVIMPKWTPGGGALTYFDAAGPQKGPLHLALWLVSHPINLVQDLLATHTNRNTLRHLLQAYGYLPLFSPVAYLMAAPNLVARFLSPEYQRHLLDFHYNASLSSILAFSTIMGTANIQSVFARLARGKAKQSRIIISTVACIVLLTGTYYSSWKDSDLPLHQLGRPEFTDVRYQPRLAAGALDIVKEMIPKNKSVSAANGLIPQLSTRQYVYNFPEPLPKQAQWVVLSDQFKTWPLHKGEMIEYIEKYKEDKAYEMVYGEYGIYAFKKINNKPLGQ